jgi:hypothetical protein
MATLTPENIRMIQSDFDTIINYIQDYIVGKVAIELLVENVRTQDIVERRYVLNPGYSVPEQLFETDISTSQVLQDYGRTNKTFTEYKLNLTNLSLNNSKTDYCVIVNVFEK